jgi:hypothetical protein
MCHAILLIFGAAAASVGGWLIAAFGGDRAL